MRIVPVLLVYTYLPYPRLRLRQNNNTASPRARFSVRVWFSSVMKENNLLHAAVIRHIFYPLLSRYTHVPPYLISTPLNSFPISSRPSSASLIPHLPFPCSYLPLAHPLPPCPRFPPSPPLCTYPHLPASLTSSLPLPTPPYYISLTSHSPPPYTQPLPPLPTPLTRPLSPHSTTPSPHTPQHQLRLPFTSPRSSSHPCLFPR